MFIGLKQLLLRCSSYDVYYTTYIEVVLCSDVIETHDLRVFVWGQERQKSVYCCIMTFPKHRGGYRVPVSLQNLYSSKQIAYCIVIIMTIIPPP